MSDTTMTIPAGLPLLCRGVGQTPEDGGCLVQVASRLRDGRSWTDEPKWLHPTMTAAAIAVNDHVPDGYRPVLAPLAADLAGLRQTRRMRPPRRLTVDLAVWTARRVLGCDTTVPTPQRVHADLAVALAAAGAMDYRAGEWAMQAIRSAPATGWMEWTVVHACRTVTARGWETAWRVGSYAAAAVAEDAKLTYPGRTKGARVARYEAQREFLAALIDRYRELTEPTGPDTRRWEQACELTGVTR